MISTTDCTAEFDTSSKDLDINSGSQLYEKLVGLAIDA